MDLRYLTYLSNILPVGRIKLNVGDPESFFFDAIMNTINFSTGRICNLGLTDTDGSASTFQWRKNNVLFLISRVHWL